MTHLPPVLPPVQGGTLYGVGVGPGCLDYLTLRAATVLRDADEIAYFAKKGGAGTGRSIVAPILSGQQPEIRMIYPMTTELPPDHPEYRRQLAEFYESTCADLADRLRAGRSIAVLCEGDPFFYGSFMHLWRRLVDAFPVEIVPGISGMSGCWTRSGQPITWGDDVLTVLPGTLPQARLTQELLGTDAAVIMKIGRNLPKIRRALEEAGVLDRAIYVERGTMAGEKILPLAGKSDDEAPYFAIVLVPGQGRRP